MINVPVNKYGCLPIILHRLLTRMDENVLNVMYDLAYSVEGNIFAKSDHANLEKLWAPDACNYFVFDPIHIWSCFYITCTTDWNDTTHGWIVLNNLNPPYIEGIYKWYIDFDARHALSSLHVSS